MKDAVALAEALRKAGDPTGAQRVMDEVLKRDPQSLEPIRQRAAACAAQGDLDSAASLLEQILAKEKSPFALAVALAESMVPRAGTSSRARIACANVFIAVGRPFASVRMLLPVVARNPGDLAARRTLGLAYARLGAGPQAEEHLLGVVKRGMADAEVCKALGEVYLERGETASGIKALERARDAKPDDVDVRRALARALAAQGNLDGAIKELKAAHSGSGSDDNALEDELDRITERSFTKRIKELEARLLSNEEDSQARLELAVALSRRGDLTEAIEHLEHVSRRRAFTAQALAKTEQIADEYDGPAPRALVLLLASLHESSGNPERGIEVLEHHLEASPDDPEVQLVLFKTQAKSHRIQDAVSGLESFMESATPYYLQEAAKLANDLLEKESSRALAHPLARARRRLGDLEGATALYERVLEWEPELTEARVEYARMLEGAGRRAEAYEVLKVLVEGSTGSTAEIERLATLALGAGKLNEAVALLQRAVDRHPEDLALKHALEATQARLRQSQIRRLEGATDLDERLELAGLYVENGNKAEAMRTLRALGRLDIDQPDLSFLRFSAEHFAKQGKEDKAEAALRLVGRSRGYAPGSDPHKELLYRISTLYEQSANRRGARRVLLEIYAQDPNFKDVAQRLEVLSEDVRGMASGVADERMLELVDVGAPLGTIFDTLQSTDLALDPALLTGKKSSTDLRSQ
jgi:tetratricopeptide (TPR) repeat protein